VELYLDEADPATNKAAFDQLYQQREVIEATFGGQLYWQRLDDKRASRVSFSVLGGWVDKGTWPSAIEQAVAGMKQFYGALADSVEYLRSK
jgi:hypothetical protein